MEARIVKVRKFNHHPDSEIELKIELRQDGRFDATRCVNSHWQKQILGCSRACAEWNYFDWLQFEKRLAFELQWGPRKGCNNR